MEMQSKSQYTLNSNFTNSVATAVNRAGHCLTYLGSRYLEELVATVKPCLAEKNRPLWQVVIRVVALFAMSWVIVPTLIGSYLRLCTSGSRRDFAFYRPKEHAPVQEISELKVSSFNVALLPDFVVRVNGLRPGKERVDEIAQALIDRDDDVITLQECFHTEHADTLVKRLSKKYPYIIANVGVSTTRISSGLFVASKYPITAAQYARFDKLYGECAYSNKGTLSFTLDVGGGKRINCMTTHLQARMPEMKQYPGRSPQRRMELVGELESRAKAYQACFPANHFLATGDFNIYPYCEEWEIFREKITTEYTEKELKDGSTAWENCELRRRDKGVGWKRKAVRILDHIGTFTHVAKPVGDGGFVIDPMEGSSDHLAMRRTVRF